MNQKQADTQQSNTPEQPKRLGQLRSATVLTGLVLTGLVLTGLVLIGLTVGLLALLHSVEGKASSPRIASASTLTDPGVELDIEIADMQSEPEQQDMFLPIVQTVGPNAFCRFGVNLNTLGTAEAKNMNNYDIQSLGIGWYINYASSPSYSSTRVEHAPMIRLTQPTTDTYKYFPTAEGIKNVVENNPGADWFISNEPDRIKYQDSVQPDVYAEAYHELYTLIKGLDPAAQIFAGSIVQPTEIRLQYLDLILAAYQDKFGEAMPVDGWSIHNFILNEASCEHYQDNVSICWGADIPPAIDAVDGLRIGIEQHHDIDLFKTQILRFRNWMKENGYGGKPVYLSEYGVLLPDWYKPAVAFGAAEINQFMSDSFDYMLNTTDPELGDPRDGDRLIQRFSWYSVNDDYESGPPYIYNGSLFKPTNFQRSPMGSNYANYTANLSPEVDIYPVSVSATVTNSTGTAGKTVFLSTEIANSGNLVDSANTYVTFFNGNPAEDGERIGTPQPISLAGCGDATMVEMTWSDVVTGTYDIFVQVDGETNLDETDERNNLLKIEVPVEDDTPGTP